MVLEPDPAVALAEAADRMRGCERCPELVAARTQVVCGTGAPTARVLIVGDAPRSREDALGVPLSGRALELLERFLLAAGCPPEDRFLTTLVKCLPPLARDPSATEVAGCSEHLETEVALLAPLVVVGLGGFVAGVLRGRPSPVRRSRGREEPCLVGPHAAWLLPVFHPAAALYDPATVPLLEADLARIPELLARGRPELAPEPAPDSPAPDAVPGPGQLDLF